jgi:hypothetical protein
MVSESCADLAVSHHSVALCTYNKPQSSFGIVNVTMVDELCDKWGRSTSIFMDTHAHPIPSLILAIFEYINWHEPSSVCLLQKKKYGAYFHDIVASHLRFRVGTPVFCVG